MVAVIKSGSSIHRILNYNEHKVKEGVARCLAAGNYPINATELTLNQKLNRLLKQAQLNENVRRNGMHISLNFAPGEALSNEALVAIASEYMEGIGFGEQPYLVYQHLDAAHPHLHLISIKIDAKGKRIDTQNIGKNRSEPVRKALEKKYGLVRAELQNSKQVASPEPLTSPVGYGHLPTKKAIGKVLEQVLTTYKYASIPELNAVLKSYGVMADRGGESSRVYQKQGLYYRLIDGDGNKLGVPIKASLYHQNPGMKYLNGRFKLNLILKKADQLALKNTIDQVMQTQLKSIDALVNALKAKQVEVVLRNNAQGIIYGITYVDHRSKSVFNGSALGKKYSTKAILAQLGTGPQTLTAAAVKPSADQEKLPAAHADFERIKHTESGMLQLLFQAENTYDPVPYPLKRSRKKKKKRKVHHL